MENINIQDLLTQIIASKKGLSLVMDNQNIMPEDIVGTFNTLSDKAIVSGVQYFRFDAYSIVSGDSILKVQYTKDNKKYFMLVGINNYNSMPKQIAVGQAINDKIYMMYEDLPTTSSINFIAFPKFVINQRTNGFALRCYRDTMHLLLNRLLTPSLDTESIKCLEAGFESMKEFCVLINQIKSQDKRKKLSIYEKK